MAAPSIGRRARWAPANAQVDWSNPLTAGMVAYVLPGRNVELVNRSPMSRGVSTVLASPWGPCNSITGVAAGSSQASSVTIPTASLATAAGSTCYVYGRKASTTGNYQYFISAGTALGTNNPLLLRSTSGADGGTGMTAFRANAGGFRAFKSSQSVPGTEWLSFGFIFADNTITTAPTLVFNGGVYTTSSYTGTGSGTVTSTAGDSYFGSRPDAAGGDTTYNCEITVAILWGRALTTAQLLSVADDPFALLRF